MYVIIVGCGALGARVAELLSDERHNVVVIDLNKEAFARLPHQFNGITVVGNGIDINVLREAGAEKADALVGLTGSDNANLMAAQVARKIFNVPKVLAKLVLVDKQELYERLGIEVVSPVAMGAMHVRNRIVAGNYRRYLFMEKDGIEIVRAPILPKLVGKRVMDVQKWGQAVISLVIRGDIAFVPDLETVFEPDDQVLLSVSAEGLSYAKRMFKMGE